MKYFSKITSKILVALLLLILCGLFYLNASINLQSYSIQSSTISIIKRVYDENGINEFSPKHLNDQEIILLQEEFDNKKIYLKSISNGYTTLPYLPITEYQIYFYIEGKSGKTITFLEDGNISIDYNTYFYLGNANLFKLIDGFFETLN